MTKLFSLFIIFLLILASTGKSYSSVRGSAETDYTLKGPDYFQQVTVTGTITDNTTGEPMTGVTILLKGTNTGLFSNLDGKYSITITDLRAILVFSYVGYETQEIEVAGQKTIDVKLVPSLEDIDEVVVVAYGTQKKSSLTGSVASLKAEKLDEIPVARIDQALQGRMAGVQITNVSPLAGDAPQIRVRGLGSISTNIDPLIVVDGFPVQDGLSMISMGDVESIEVLKDASSSSLYGSRAANGVILITTKSGNISKPRYNFKMYKGNRSAYKIPGVLSTSQQVRLFREEAAMRMLDPSVDGTALTMPFDLTAESDQLSYLLIDYAGGETDWVHEALRNPGGSIQSYQLSASGGDKGSKYYISGNYNSEEGVMKFSKYDKFSFRTKLDSKLSKNITVGVNFSPTFSLKTAPSEDLTVFLRHPSWVPIRHTEASAALTGRQVGEYAHPSHYGRYDLSGPGLDNEIWHVTSASASGSSVHNPVSVNERTDISTKDYRLQSNAYLSIDILSGLQFKTSNGVYAAFNEFNEKAQSEASKDGEPNSLTRITNLRTDLLSENTLNYTKKIGDHDIGALVGFTMQKTTNENNRIIGTNFPDEELLSFNMATVILLDSPLLPGTTSYSYSEAMMSYLGRINYAYKGKYLLSASFRSDGSSKFAEGHKWGSFPAASVGWRVSEESFLKNNNVISNLKLRFSYGLTGNNNIPQYSYMNSLNTSNFDLGSGTGNLVPGLASNDDATGNPLITWEQTSEANYGVDLGLYKNRVNLTVEYYNSTTIQLLLKQPAMYITGHQTFWNNIGNVNNSGIEMELSTTNVNTKNFTWKTTANFSDNKNKLINYGNKDKEDNFGERNEVYRAMVGQPSIQYFGYKSDGVYVTFEEVAAAKAKTDTDGVPFNYGDFTPVIGGLKVVNVNGDNKIDSDDRVVIGNPFPDFTWGITNTLIYKGFDLSFLFQGVHGLDVIDGNMNYNETLRTNTAYTDNRFVSPMFPGDGKTVYGTNTPGKALLLSDYAVQDGSYAALRDITLGFTAPKEYAKKIKINSFRVYISAQNPLYIMARGYNGVNPEARRTSGTYNNPLIDGYQRGVYPINRTYTAGVDITF